MEFEDFYALLDAEQGVSAEIIRSQFRKKMREWHPDVNKSPKATEHTQRLIVAYKILSDPEARRRYDVEYDRHCQRNRAEKHSYVDEDAAHAASPTTGYSDRDLERWVRSAREAAAHEMKAFASELKAQSKVAVQAAMRILAMMAIFAIFGLILMAFG